MEIVIVLVLLVVTVVGVAILSRRGSSAVTTGLTDAAAELGARVDGDTLRGRVRGVDLTVDQLVISDAALLTDQNVRSEHGTRDRLELSPWTVPVEMRARSMVGRLADAATRTTDVSIGIQEFDDAIHVTTADPSAVRDALGPERRQLVIELLDSLGPNEVTDSGLVIHVRGDHRKYPKALVAKANELVESAHQLRDAPPRSPPRP